MEDAKHVFWTNSKVVLSYLHNTTRRFKTFVANRVQAINSTSELDSWNYVKSEDNPGDISSRGISTKDSSKAKIWIHGPDFLWQQESTWSQSKCSTELDTNDVELKKVNAVTIQDSPPENAIVALIRRISNWKRLCHIIGWIIRFTNRSRKLSNTKNSGSLSVAEVQEAGQRAIIVTQQIVFVEEIAALRKQDYVSERSTISSLSPFVDESGILRVGGRLRRSNLEFQLRHPILLPKNHELSKLIVRWCHEQSHRGRLHTPHELRNNGYWVVNGNAFVRKIIYHCVICRYLRGTPGTQIMADLPKARVVESPPFSYVGVDFFGPFIVKEARKELKRYGVIFTCFSTRAVHLEVSSSLETDTFIMSLRRFIARRGKVRALHSDNGTNFVGAENELRKALSEMDHAKVMKFLNEQDADWIWNFNPPASSHMGGVWERHIRSIRRILAALLKSQGPSMNTESLITLFVEVESIINCRPLTVDTVSDPTEPMPLSPMNLLTMKSKVVLPPPGEFDESDLYSRKRWRRIQFLANEFWERWRKEYLSHLQHRTKWRTKKRDFKCSDIVLLKDTTLTNSRNEWPMGKIVNVYPDDFGRVRSADCLIGRNVYKRPVTKLVLLVESSIPDEEPEEPVII